MGCPTPAALSRVDPPQIGRPSGGLRGGLSRRTRVCEARGPRPAKRRRLRREQLSGLPLRRGSRIEPGLFAVQAQKEQLATVRRQKPMWMSADRTFAKASERVGRLSDWKRDHLPTSSTAGHESFGARRAGSRRMHRRTRGARRHGRCGPCRANRDSRRSRDLPTRKGWQCSRVKKPPLLAAATSGIDEGALAAVALPRPSLRYGERGRGVNPVEASRPRRGLPAPTRRLSSRSMSSSRARSKSGARSPFGRAWLVSSRACSIFRAERLRLAVNSMR